MPKDLLGDDLAEMNDSSSDITFPRRKIYTLGELVPMLDQLRNQGKLIVQCHGVFDIIHPGHIKHLESAKREGNVLVVTLTPDRFVNKGPGRPVFGEMLRSVALGALECVDYVAINDWPSAENTIRMLRPDVYAKGIEYAKPEKDVTGKIGEEEAAVIEAGGRVAYTDDEIFSSSDLINRYFQQFPDATEKWLEDFRRKYSSDQIISYLEDVRDLKPLVFGEAIIDEYVSCEALGKSAKDPILSFRYKQVETFAGGSLAVANHLAGLCDEVELLTLIGDQLSRQQFICDSLCNNVTPRLVTREGVPTIHKRRFVDEHTGTKVMELYQMDDSPMPLTVENTLNDGLSELLDDCRSTFVTDYGHGMISRNAVDILVKKSPFLVVNTQANSGNRGFHTISKFPAADYICLNGLEVELDTRHRELPFREQILEVAKHIDCPCITTTQGRDGSLHYVKGQGFTQAPAMAISVVDRVGAGDAVLAITGLLAAKRVPIDVIAFFTNIVGAEMVNSLGNKTRIERRWLDRHIIAILR